MASLFQTNTKYIYMPDILKALKIIKLSDFIENPQGGTELFGVQLKLTNLQTSQPNYAAYHELAKAGKLRRRSSNISSCSNGISFIWTKLFTASLLMLETTPFLQLMSLAKPQQRVSCHALTNHGVAGHMPWGCWGIDIGMGRVLDLRSNLGNDHPLDASFMRFMKVLMKMIQLKYIIGYKYCILILAVLLWSFYCSGFTLNLRLLMLVMSPQHVSIGLCIFGYQQIRKWQRNRNPPFHLSPFWSCTDQVVTSPWPKLDLLIILSKS